MTSCGPGALQWCGTPKWYWPGLPKMQKLGTLFLWPFVTIIWCIMRIKSSPKWNIPLIREVPKCLNHSLMCGWFNNVPTTIRQWRIAFQCRVIIVILHYGLIGFGWYLCDDEVSELMQYNMVTPTELLVSMTTWLSRDTHWKHGGCPQAFSQCYDNDCLADQGQALNCPRESCWHYLGREVQHAFIASTSWLIFLI